MSKLSVFCATALMAVAGVASAGTIPLYSSTTSQTISNTKEATTPIAISTVSEANGAYVSFNFKYTGTLQDNDFFAIFFGTSDDPNFGLKANGGNGSTTSDVFGRMSGGGGTYVANSNLVAGTDYQIVGWLSKSGNSSGNYNTLKVWLNPDANELNMLTGADITITGNTGIASFNTVGFRTANIDNGVSLTVSNINVTQVPEPGSLALMGLAAAGLGFARRRKNAA